jgi:hypothetical protein
MCVFTGQLVLVGTALSEGYSHRFTKGARYAMLCICDCDRLTELGLMDDYVAHDGLDAGRLLDETFGSQGWSDITIKACLPLADRPDGWVSELEILIDTAKLLGVAHMVFEPDADRPKILH